MVLPLLLLRLLLLLLLLLLLRLLLLRLLLLRLLLLLLLLRLLLRLLLLLLLLPACTRASICSRLAASSIDWSNWTSDWPIDARVLTSHHSCTASQVVTDVTVTARLRRVTL